MSTSSLFARPVDVASDELSSLPQEKSRLLRNEKSAGKRQERDEERAADRGKGKGKVNRHLDTTVAVAVYLDGWIACRNNDDERKKIDFSPSLFPISLYFRSVPESLFCLGEEEEDDG